MTSFNHYCFLLLQNFGSNKGVAKVLKHHRHYNIIKITKLKICFECCVTDVVGWSGADWREFSLLGVIHKYIATTVPHTSLEGHLGYEKCLQGSVNGFWVLLMGYFENQLSPKYWLGAFWENQFF